MNELWSGCLGAANGLSRSADGSRGPCRFPSALRDDVGDGGGWEENRWRLVGRKTGEPGMWIILFDSGPALLNIQSNLCCWGSSKLYG